MFVGRGWCWATPPDTCHPTHWLSGESPDSTCGAEALSAGRWGWMYHCTKRISVLVSHLSIMSL